MRQIRHILLIVCLLVLLNIPNVILHNSSGMFSVITKNIFPESHTEEEENTKESAEAIIDSNQNLISNATATSLLLSHKKLQSIGNGSLLEKQEISIREMHMVETRRKPVKLTMKQGLIMNQMLGMYALDNAENELCRNHSREFKIGIRAMEPWALKMFDSSSKVQAGILTGNLFEFGAFSQCIGINYDSTYGPIYGKSCYLHVKPTLVLIKKILSFRGISEKRYKKIKIMVDNITLSWSVCVPHSCPAEDIWRHYNRMVTDLTEGLALEVSLNKNHCYTLDSTPKLGETTEEIIALSILSLFVLLVFVATILEISRDNNNKFFDVFSMVSNTKRIFAHSRPQGMDLECLHGIRFLSTCYVIIGHRYLTSLLFPTVNALDILDWIPHYTSTFIIGGTVCVDTFFVITAILVSIGFFEHVTATKKFNIFEFYSYRYLRITLPLAVVVLVYATLAPHFGSGPLWYDSYKSIQVPCQQYWWAALLHSQAYTNPAAICVLQTWSLSADMPFYYISPAILYPLWKQRKVGYVVLFLAYILSVFISFYLAWINEYEGAIPITNQLLVTKYFTEHYIVPHARISPYFLGLGFGYLLFKTKNVPIKISRPVNITGWIASIILLCVVIMGCHNFLMEDHTYNRFEASIFLALSRSGWAVGICWIIWSCVRGYGGIVNSILSSHLFRVLGRISYGMFLLHLMFQFLKCGSTKLPVYFSNLNAISDGLADISIVAAAGFLFTIFFELPLIRLISIMFRSKGSKKQINPAPADNK